MSPYTLFMKGYNLKNLGHMKRLYLNPSGDQYVDIIDKPQPVLGLEIATRKALGDDIQFVNYLPEFFH